MTDLAIGTPHSGATCCWCTGPLVWNRVEQLGCWTCREAACQRRQVSWALVSDYASEAAAALALKPGRYCWHVPLPTQVEIYELGLTGGAILWGGMKGSAKSLGVRRWLYHRSITVPGHEALLLRENMPQLHDNHMSKMPAEVRQLGGRWFADPPRAVFNAGSDESVITCGHMSDADSVLRYQGGNKGAIACDEGSLYPTDAQGVSVLPELRTMARATGVDRQGRTIHPVFVVATNPGGPSAEWLREMFVDHAPNYDMFPRLRGTYDPARWHYLPARLESNPYLDAEEYRAQNLSGLSEVKYRQLAEGDWAAFAGAFFPELVSSQHFIEAHLV